jgi:hypothetical protein
LRHGGFLNHRNHVPANQGGAVAGVEEEGDVARPKMLADRATVVIAKVDIQNGCGDFEAIQR